MRVLVLASLAFLGTPTLWASPNQLSEIQVDVIEEAQPLRDVLGRLGRDHDLNYVVNEDLLEKAGLVTVRLRGVPLDIALQSICSACGLSLEIRGPVLVVLPKHERQGPLLPDVDEGLTRRPLDQERPKEPIDGPREPAPARRPPPLEPEPLARAVGKLEQIDREEGRLTLIVDGVRRNFYVPAEEQDVTGRVERLRSAIHTLKPGTRIALQYRRHPTRPTVTDLVGGAYAGTRRGDAVERDPRDQHRDDEGEDEDSRVPQGVTGSGGDSPQRLPGEVLEAAGFLAGTFQGIDGEVVTIERADGQRFELYLPAEADAERRARVQKGVGGLEVGKKIGVTYEELDGRPTIQDTITQAN